MSLILLKLQADILDYVKLMPERSVTDNLNFEVWGKVFASEWYVFI
jgi:hypothetical protein